MAHKEPKQKGKGGAPLGNTNSARGRVFLDTLRRLIAHDDAALPETRRRLYKAATALLNSAAEGEEWAIKELANRLDGKAVQGVELSNPDGSGLNLFDTGMLRGMSSTEIAQLRELLSKAGAAAKTK